VLPIELRSALRRRVSEGTLESARVPEILKRVSADRAYWTFVEVGAEVLGAAEKLVAVHPLRTLDAIHVASAQVFAAGVSEADLMFVSADKRQTEAAAVIGLAPRYIA
jgi:predicted nucleic acid-binding protein